MRYSAAILFLLLAMSTAPQPLHVAHAQPPKVANPFGDVTPVPTTQSIALVGGKWIVAETKDVAATILVDGNAKHVQVSARRLVTVSIGGQTIDVLTAAPVEVMEIDVKDGRCFGIIAGPGRYQITTICSDPKLGIHTDTSTIQIGKPDEPDVEPEPDDPEPTPSELPFESDGFACLIVKEASGTATLPESQRAIFSSSDVVRLVRGSAIKLSDGEPFFRMWDDDYTDDELTDVPRELSAAYRKVLKQADGKTPWIAVTNGKDKGYSGPLPQTVDATLKLIQENM
mgnify:CR=1 FL=1